MLAPDFVFRLVSQEVAEGDPLKWTVRTSGEPEPFVSWLKNSEPIETSSRIRLIKVCIGRKTFLKIVLNRFLLIIIILFINLNLNSGISICLFDADRQRWGRRCGPNYVFVGEHGRWGSEHRRPYRSIAGCRPGELHSHHKGYPGETGPRRGGGTGWECDHWASSRISIGSSTPIGRQ